MPAKAAIISVDGHVKPSRQAYREYLDPEHRETFDDWLRTVDGTPDGFVHPRLDAASQWDASRRIADLETQGVVAEVVFSNGQPFDSSRIDHTADPVLTRQANVAYNRWLVDFCAQTPGRFCGLAAVDFDDVDQAVGDIHWAKEHGLGGVQMPPLHPGGKYFFDPALDPIWSACVEVGFALSQHGGGGAPDYQPTSFASFMVLATEHSFYSGRSLWQLILGGVFDRFPTLKIAYVETESWWIAPVLQLLDRRETMGDDWTEFAEMLQRMKPYTRLPSEYWRSNCYTGLSPFRTNQFDLDELTNESARYSIRADRAMVGADYPHPETVFPIMFDEVRSLVEHPSVSDADARRVLYENAASLYGFDLAALQPHIERVGFDLADVPRTSADQHAAASIFEVVPSFMRLAETPPSTTKPDLHSRS
jgi:predicted TIM-barrel fold metal-dependent hydrolase